jgi:molecular chaperone DnaK
MKKEAEENADKDKERKESIEARNHLDSSIYQAEKTVREAIDLKKDEFKEVIEEVNKMIPESKKVLEDKDAAAEVLKKSAEELTEKLMALGQKMHETGNDPKAAEGEKKAEESGEPEIIDADFEESKKKDKK